MNKRSILQLSFTSYLLFVAAFAAQAAAFDRDLTVGSRGSDVESLQNFLTEQGVYSGPVTGYFGNLTRAGVINFQIKNSITPSVGYFGPKTRAIANKSDSISTPTTQVGQTPSAQLTIAELQGQIAVLMAELKKLQDASIVVSTEPPVATTTPVTPAPAPDVFSGSVKIFSIYPNVTISSYDDVALNEYQISASSEKVAITKLRLTNSGTLSDVYFNEVRLINSSNNEVLAKIDAPTEKVIEFSLVKNSAKKDNGLMVSGGVYAIRAAIKTPNIGSEAKPNIKLDIVSTGDVTAVDYETLSRPAKSESVFPIEGPYITTF